MKDLLIIADYDFGTEFSILWEKVLIFPKYNDPETKLSANEKEANTIRKMWGLLKDEEFKRFLKERYSSGFKRIIYVENGDIETLK